MDVCSYEVIVECVHRWYRIHFVVCRSDNRWRGCGATLLGCNPVIIVTAAHCLEVRCLILS